MTELWMPVLGYEGYYEASDQGQVRSLDRMSRCGPGGRSQLLRRGRVLTPTISKKDGRRRVCLCVNNQKKLRTVATLVLEAFAGPRPDPYMDCCHGDGDQANDVLSNLRWDTKSANQTDRIRHGRNHQANKTHCKRGHNLVAPNLAVGQAGRSCRACLDTHGWARGGSVVATDSRWAAEADARFREITTRTGRYSGEKQTQCLRGHDLVLPNLVARSPGRACLTCSNTRAWAFTRDVGSADARWIAEADRRYAEIMGRTKKPTRGAGKTECARGHLLRPPNLRAGHAKRCRACGNAQAWAHGRGIPVGDPRWVAEADRRYGEIMK